jgi:polyhydroxybutyrate depolymerase
MRSVCWLAALASVMACGSPSSPVTGDDASVDAPPDAADLGPCGQRAGARGLSHRDVTIGGAKRTYLVYLPAGVDATAPVPLVLVFHGYTMSGQAMVDTTDFTKLADTEHIALAFPDGQGGPNSTGAPWNVGTNICPSLLGPPPQATGDDFAFIDAMKADVHQDQCIDRDHIYVTGFSMGGYFSHHAGCMRSDVRAVAPHSGGTHDLAGCANAKEPIIMFHGASDPVIPAGCDDPMATAVSGVEPAATAWAKHNGCSTQTTTIDVKNGTCTHFEGCPTGGQVEVCRFPGMGHCWAGGNTVAGCPTYANATQLAWQFWKTYAF